MPTILMDENIDGYAEYLSRLITSPAWADIGSVLGVSIVQFRHIGQRRNRS